MANTVIKLKKSATPSEAPIDLEYGEIAINYADGRLYYKDATDSIKHISAGNNYSTVNVGGTFLTAAIENAILSIGAGNNIELTPDFLNDAFTITANLKAAFDIANAAFNAANSAGGSDFSSIFGTVNAAFDKANNAVIRSGDTMTGTLYYNTVNTGIGQFWAANSLDVFAKNGHVAQLNYDNTNFIWVNHNTAGIALTNTFITFNDTSSSISLNSNDFTASGNVSAIRYFGDGSQLTGVIHDISSVFDKANAALPAVTSSNLTFTQSIPLTGPNLSNTAGERIILWPQRPGGPYYNYSIGLENDAIWFGVDTGLATEGFNWYQGNTNIMKLARNGNLTVSYVNTDNIKFGDNTIQSTAFRYDLVNTAFNIANAAFDSANNVAPQVTPAFDKANSKTYTFYQTSAPATSNAHDLWVNTDTGVVYENFGTTSAPIWAEFGPVGVSSYTTTNRDTQAYDTANAAFDYANTITGGSGSGTANAAYVVANVAFDSTNAVGGYANTVGLYANQAGVIANAAFDKANTTNTYAYNANTYANTTYLKKSGGTISGDLSVTGNLNILGNTTTFSSNNLIINDSIIYLANNNTGGDLVDIGFIGHYSNGAANVHTGLFRDHASKEYYLFNGYDGEPDQVNDIVPYGNNMVNAVLNADLITSNLTLGTANAIVWIKAAYDNSNSGFNQSNTAYTTVNSAFGVTNAAFGHSNTTYTAVNSAFGVINAAFGKANTALQNTSGTFAGDLTVTGNVIHNKQAVVYYTPSSPVNAAIHILAANTLGGTGYADVLKLQNISGGVTNPGKSIRLNQTGGLEIINSAYSATLLTLSDSGDMAVSGNVTMSGIQPGYSVNRPGFRVTGAGTTNNLTTTQNGTGVLTANNFAVDYNQGSYLNTSTGTFTAPVAGLYQVNVTARNSGYASGISQICALKNGNIIIMVEWASSSTMNHAGGSTVVKLAVGDTLTLKVTGGQINFDGNDNWSVAYIG